MDDETASLHVGDVVRLRSGGPAMVVGEMTPGGSDDRWCICHWFRGEDHHTASLPFGTLEIMRPWMAVPLPEGAGIDFAVLPYGVEKGCNAEGALVPISELQAGKDG